MAKFVFVYHGRAMRAEDVKAEDMKATMDKWMAWFGTFQDKMVDGGNPFGPDAVEVTASGSQPVSASMHPATGYTIVNAENIEEAASLAKGCPVLENGGAIRVYEAMPM